MFRSPLSWLLVPIVAVLVAFAWCSSVTVKVPTPATASARSVPESNPAPARLRVVSITPDRLAIDGNRVAPQVLEVAYTIQDPSQVTTATLRLWVPEVGDLAGMEVPAQASATVRFIVDPREHAVGPEVRFRATCPEGATDWHTLGQMPPALEVRDDVFRIRNVIPYSIGWNESDRLNLNLPNRRGQGKRVILTGNRFTAACGIDAQVNRSPVALQDVKYDRKSLQGVLMYSDIGFQRIAPRYAELKLSLRGPSLAMSAIQKMAFKHPGN